MCTSGGSSDDNIPESYKESVYAPPAQIRVYESLFSQANGCVCRVQAPPIPPNPLGSEGTADLYELAEGVFTIATNNRVIPITDAHFLVNIVFSFEGLKQIRLSKKEIKFCSTNRELDATVIELTDACARRLQQLGAKFIRVSTASGGHQISEGEFCYDKRAIQEFKVNDVTYYLGGAADRTGCPILLWGYRAIGKQTQIRSSHSSVEHRALVPIRNGNPLLATTVFQLSALRYVV